jgi:uncharacterized membrane protein
MKAFWLVITIEENKLYYSYMMKISETDNIHAKLKRITCLKSVYIFSTKKRAAEIVERWNANYKLNGTYMFNN